MSDLSIACQIAGMIRLPGAASQATASVWKEPFGAQKADQNNLAAPGHLTYHKPLPIGNHSLLLSPAQQTLTYPV